MPNILSKTLWIALAGVAAAQAQNSDLGLLAGFSGPRSQVSAGPVVYASGSVGASGQLNYAWQVLQRAVDLYVELPLVFTGSVRGTVAGSFSSARTGADLFFTPGVRVKFAPQSRVSLYGAVGGGLGSFGITESRVGPDISVNNRRTTTGALDFGGGIDFRLTRLLSLRVEARDFLTRAGLGEVTGRNHEMFQVGIAFHF